MSGCDIGLNIKELMEILAGRCRHDDQRGEQEMALHSAEDWRPDDKEKNCMVETLRSRTEYRIQCRSNMGALCGGEVVSTSQQCCEHRGLLLSRELHLQQ